MDSDLFVRSVVLGLSVAAPVGPIGVLCIRRTLAAGRLTGFATGLGAATADALYGCVAGFGLSLVADWLVGNSLWVRLLGGLFLCYLGVRTFVARPAEQVALGINTDLVRAYTSALLLTLTNPLTILSFTALFAGLGTDDTSYASAVVVVGGMFAGSSLWWLLLAGSVGSLSTRITPHTLRWINRVSGLTLCCFGGLVLSSLC